ncbi:LysR family transcriptional regulator [Burkholderia sp. WAC0059]|uniref:LysR family transcriptional regulator n=1 Tax=Burkholderia sp. WAC0059 TaxID=2066022 RepID=UPI000C7E9634|nr:LysR family transcriptional regulator [Burkholderia sp. WAC0059]PLZ00958.1 LysR family transcriptional regulator [Burkholderia sp. WAC0059]
MDRLTSIEVFVRVVELGGFTAAAGASDISPTMVSNHIQALERHLGAKLLNRTTRRQSLTEIGAAYYAKCVDILARIDAADSEAQNMHTKPAGKLRISAPITLGSHLLVPALSDYLRDFPDVSIDLQLNDRVVDLVEEGFDAALRFGRMPDSGLVVRPLRSLNRVICAAPRYLDARGTPATPEDLREHNCLAFHYITPEREWQFDGSTKETETIEVSGQLSVNNGPALLQAVLSGIGIAMLPDYLVQESIDAGRLVRLLPGYDFPRAPLQLIYLPDRHMTPKLRSFIDFVTMRLDGKS